MVITTDTVLTAIQQYIGQSANASHFTTMDIARHMRANEYSVRTAFTHLVRYGLIEVVQGVRTRRYLGQPEDPTKRRHTDSYSAAVYQLRKVSESEVNFAALMGVFCRG